MTKKQRDAETLYRLCVIQLEEMRICGMLNEEEYDRIRVYLASFLSAPYGMLEAEDMLWKREL